MDGTVRTWGHPKLGGNGPELQGVHAPRRPMRPTFPIFTLEGHQNGLGPRS